MYYVRAADAADVPLPCAPSAFRCTPASLCVRPQRLCHCAPVVRCGRAERCSPNCSELGVGNYSCAWRSQSGCQQVRVLWVLTPRASPSFLPRATPVIARLPSRRCRPSMTPAHITRAVEAAAHELAEEDVAVNDAIGQAGAELVPAGANMLHHCNTGSLATVDVGTALGVIYSAHAAGKGVHVWVDETRPRLQGARLTAWELMKAGVPMHLIADNASGHLMAAGKVDVVVFGADRVAANGDTANKIGTYKLAVVAKEHSIPVYACVPTSTIDLALADGSGIPIEERGADEVAAILGEYPIAPAGVPVYNPAFDVTPAKFITAIVTEEGVCYPPFQESLAAAVQRANAKRSAAEQALVERCVASATE